MCANLDIILVKMLVSSATIHAKRASMQKFAHPAHKESIYLNRYVFAIKELI